LHLPVNAPKWPTAQCQQDGHMAIMNPQDRVNHEPKSWDPPNPARAPQQPSSLWSSSWTGGIRYLSDDG
jgi:catalase